MKRKSVLMIVILAMLLSCRAVSGQPASTPPPTDFLQPSEPPAQAVPPSPNPKSPPTALAAELTADRELNQFLPDTPIRIRFNQSMDPDSSKLALITYPWVEGTLRWEEDNTQLVFEPTSGYTADTRYQVFLNQSLRGASGGQFLEQFQWEFQVLDRPRVLAHQPSAAAIGNFARSRLLPDRRG